MACANRKRAQKDVLRVRLVPNHFFHLSADEACLLSVTAFVIGLVIGPLLAAWANRLCDEPPRRRETLITTLLTGCLFALGTFAIVALEGQRIHEVIPSVFWRNGRLLSHFVLLALLITATATDLREYIIPDWITYSGTLFGVLLATVSGDTQLIHFWVDWNHPLVGAMGPEIPEWIKQHPHLHGLAWSLAGATVGAGITWLSRLISSFVLGQEAMGFGDVTLMAMIGSFLGWQPMVFVFLLAPFCGIFVGIAVKTMLNRSFVPYGPYLSVAALIVMFYWRWIWQWEPTPHVSIRKLFGDIPSLAILAAVSFVLLSVLLAIARWWRGSALIVVEFPDQVGEGGGRRAEGGDGAKNGETPIP
ncbi:MAG: A24 family peptidase [Planctomycetia bacterium]|nr:A24 family peptidase [Planctomycetia bacterium]